MNRRPPSATARGVAAYRLGFERPAAPFGDPSADERLEQDVAGSRDAEPNERTATYLRARTAFFDRVVLGAMERNNTQVAVLGVGYDGRSLRYAMPGVRWFEVDHPATLVDKRLRLESLNIDASHVTFVAVDLAEHSVASALLDAGWNPDALSLMVCEGLTTYLEVPMLEAILEDMRALAGVGTRFAISASPSVSTSMDVALQERLWASTAALGEPQHNSLTAEQLGPILASARWRTVHLSEGAQQAGFLVCVPVWEPAAGHARPTEGKIGAFLERMFHRSGIDGLADHIDHAYGVAVTGIEQLDIGVFRVERHRGPDWIARVFPAARPLEAVRGDADILRYLEQADFPAERCAHPEPVTSYLGQAVLVTERVAGRAAAGARASLELLGDLLGRLHALVPPTAARPGGGWHHLILQGAPLDELLAARLLLDEAKPRVPRSQLTLYERLHDGLARADDCEGLPEALIHPDFVPANVIRSSRGEPVLVDWTGAGRGPRVWSLAFLLWAAGAQNLRGVGAVASAYRRHVELEHAELERLGAAIASRPLVFAAWAFSTGREQLADVVERLPTITGRAETIAGRARPALEAAD
jgi:methyltransferase (TIGR00027 family)